MLRFGSPLMHCCLRSVLIYSLNLQSYVHSYDLNSCEFSRTNVCVCVCLWSLENMCSTCFIASKVWRCLFYLRWKGWLSRSESNILVNWSASLWQVSLAVLLNASLQIFPNLEEPHHKSQNRCLDFNRVIHLIFICVLQSLWETLE